MGWTVNPWLAGIVTQMRSQNKAILAQLVEHSLRKREVIRSSRIDGTIVIGRSIRLATETVLKTVEPEQGLGSSTLPLPATNNRGFRRSDTGFIRQLGEGSLPSAASQNNAGIVQLVEHLTSNQDVASSSLAVRSTFRKPF